VACCSETGVFSKLAPQERRPSQPEQAAGLKRMRAPQQRLFSAVHASKDLLHYGRTGRALAHWRPPTCAKCAAHAPPTHGHLLIRCGVLRLSLACQTAAQHTTTSARLPRQAAAHPGPFLHPGSLWTGSPAHGAPKPTLPAPWEALGMPALHTARGFASAAATSGPLLQRARQTHQRGLLRRVRRPGLAARRARRTAAPRGCARAPGGRVPPECAA